MRRGSRGAESCCTGPLELVNHIWPRPALRSATELSSRSVRQISCRSGWESLKSSSRNYLAWHAKESHPSSSLMRLIPCVAVAVKERTTLPVALRPSSWSRCREPTLTTTVCWCSVPPTFHGNLITLSVVDSRSVYTSHFPRQTHVEPSSRSTRERPSLP